MKSKKKKRLLILIGAMLICLLPISFLSRVLVPWAEELGEATTEVGESPPGEATATDASSDGTLDNDLQVPPITDLTVLRLFASQDQCTAPFPHIYDFYYGYFSGTKATIYCMHTAANNFDYGFCYQHGKSSDGYGTGLTRVDGHTEFTNVNNYINEAKALMYTKWMQNNPSEYVWSGFKSHADNVCPYKNNHSHKHACDGSFCDYTGNSNCAAQSKNDIAITALACSYFSGASDEVSKASTIYGYGTGSYGNSPKAYIDFLNGLSYKDLYFLVDGVNGVKLGQKCGITGRTKADKSEDGVLMSDILTVDASTDLEWRYTIPNNYKFRVYTNAELTQYTDYNVGSTVSLRGGSKFRVYANPVIGNKTVTFDFGNNTKTICAVYCYISPNSLQNVVSKTTGNSPFSFQLEWEGTSHVALKKTSSNPNCSNNNPLYDLAGTQYTVYNQDGTPATTIAGTPAVLTCKSDGTTNILEMPIGSYKVKETKAGKGYLLNKNEIPITLTAENTVDNPLVINTTDKPVDDPISVILKKENDKNVAIKGAVYCVEYYPGIQTYSESEAQTKHSGTVSKWYFETDANGEAIFRSSPTAPGYTSSPFFKDSLGGRTIPLGTVIMYEEKAPKNYKKSDTHWVFQVKQDGEGGVAYLYDSTGKCYDDGTTVSDTNAPKFSDTPIPVNLTVQKKNGNPSPAQGSTGDVTLEGAVFGLYVKRDIVDESTGETKVKAENYSVGTPLTHSDGTPVIDPTTGKQVVAKAGTAKAIRISTATGKDGKISFNDLFPAKNADDYYVVELCAPKDFYRDKAEHSVDLRDNRTDAEKSDVNYTALSKHLDVTNQPIMQPIHVKKYVPVKDGNTTKIEPLNGAEFSVYLISSLKGDISACKVTNADGSISYNFKSYDFSNETGEVVTDDGERVLVTGSGDNDDGEVTSIDLMPGTYVIDFFCL